MAQDYPREKYEVIVIDDSSSDSTPEIMQELRMQYSNLVLAKNAGLGTADARNTGLAVARGEVIVNYSAHATAQSNFLTTIAGRLTESDDTIAGVGCRHDIPSDEPFLARLFGLAMRSPLGAMGTSHGQPKKEELRDSIAFTAYRKEIFKKIGLFDSELSEIDDGEFNFRLRKAGYKLLYTPATVVFQRQPSSVSGFVRKMVKYGRGRAKLVIRDQSSFRLPYVLPTVLVAALFLLTLASILVGNFLIVLAPVAVYYMASLVASFQQSVKTCPKCLPLIPIVQLVMHIAYGIGFAAGL